MHRGAPNIYTGEIVTLTESVMVDLKKTAGTAHHSAIYISNGHGAWEAALSNVIGPDDLVLVPSVGRFGHGWAEMAEALGADAEVMEFGRLQPVDFARVTERLAADTDHKIKAVLGVHTDTSSSIRTDPRGLRAALDAAGHPALLMSDCIASFGCDRFEMDAWGVDVMVTASQKGLMVPPGLGFVFFNDKAAAKRQQMKRVSRYWDWAPRANPEVFYQYFGGTAPTHHLYGLRESLDMIHEEGLENVWQRHETLAKAIWAAVDAWGAGGPMQLNVKDITDRSHAVTSVQIGAPDGTRLRNWLETNMGVTLGIGLGMSTPEDPDGDGFFRFGHMGHVNAHMVLGVLGAVQAGLDALDIPHGQGALEAATRVISTGGCDLNPSG
jgi:alanine-glyoxylate transaminase/serine-glyoxylate transaminase/serine-pyruvate transaminase